MINRWRGALTALLLATLLVGCGGAQAGQQNAPAGNPSAAAASTVPAGSTPPEESPQPQVSPGLSSESPQTSPGNSAGPTVAPAESSAALASPATFDPQRLALGLEPVAEGLDRPVFVTHAGDGSGRVFVVEKGGTIRTLADRQVFLDITDRVNARGNEQGLLGLAFHPRFRESGLFYVYYTAANGDNVVARYALAGDGRGDPGSEQIVLRQQDPAANHNGGMITFGPDGKLYIGLGDGGGANDQFGNGQNRDTFLGKLLRIDVDADQPYAVPPDNPFVGQSGTRPEIWALGLRNPWRFSFDRATRDMYIGDVGQNRFEWLHVRPASDRGGQNYGWPILEGRSCLRGESCERSGLTEATLDYPHSEGCSVVGGYVYRGAQYPAMQGAYIFGDYCSGTIWTLTGQGQQWSKTELLSSGAQISSFGEDEAGELYLTDYGGGTVYRVTGQPR